jgi:hypothetical protein
MDSVIDFESIDVANFDAKPSEDRVIASGRSSTTVQTPFAMATNAASDRHRTSVQKGRLQVEVCAKPPKYDPLHRLSNGCQRLLYELDRIENNDRESSRLLLRLGSHYKLGIDRRPELCQMLHEKRAASKSKKRPAPSNESDSRKSRRISAMDPKQTTHHAFRLGMSRTPSYAEAVISRRIADNTRNTIGKEFHLSLCQQTLEVVFLPRVNHAVEKLWTEFENHRAFKDKELLDNDIKLDCFQIIDFIQCISVFEAARDYYEVLLGCGFLNELELSQLQLLELPQKLNCLEDARAASSRIFEQCVQEKARLDCGGYLHPKDAPKTFDLVTALYYCYDDLDVSVEGILSVVREYDNDCMEVRRIDASSRNAVY